MSPLGDPKCSFERLVARALDSELHTGANQRRQCAQHQVQSLLRAQATDDGQDQGLVVRSQTHRLLQREATDTFAGQAAHVVWRRDRAVCRRIPHRCVYAVEDAADIGRPPADHPVEAKAIGAGGDLRCVAGADGRDLVGELQPRLHERQLAVEFDARRRHEARTQTQQRPIVVRKQPLECQVVNGKNRCGGGGQVIGHVSTSHRRMPVMGMDDLRHPGRVGIACGQVRGDPSQQRKTLQVVRPFITARRLVRTALASVEVGRVDHIDRQLVARHSPQQQARSHGTKAGSDVDQGARRLQGVQDGGQTRQQQTHIGAGIGQRGRQRSDDVGQPAGLDQRKDLGSHMQDLQAS